MTPVVCTVTEPLQPRSLCEHLAGPYHGRTAGRTSSWCARAEA